MRKFLIFRNVLIVFLMSIGVNIGNAVTVELTVEEGVTRPAALSTAEQNLSAVLTEINRAQAAKTYISNRNLRMTDFAKKSMERIWAVTPFYCPDEEVVDYCWIFQKGNMMVRNIPIIIKPNGEDFGTDTYQNVVVEFDANGVITDFRLPMSAHPITRANELDDAFGNEVSDLEQQHIIMQQLERFRTAYNQRDITAIENMFSDDALIITGHVTQRVTQGDSRMMKPQVTYNKQTKQQYIANLKRAFARNKWIQVDFSNQEIRRSHKDPTMIGIKLDQSWKSSNYSDEGCLFLIWQFRKGEDPIIHVRTWQPTKSGGMKLEINDDISTLAGFDL